MITTPSCGGETRRRVVALRPPRAPPRTPARQPAHVARMLALAHYVAAAIDAGELADQAAVARTLGFTRARLSQLLDLTLLAPDIQEQILHLEAIDSIEPMPERALRSLSRLNWAAQRHRWRCMHNASPTGRQGSRRQ
jgi:hypothetical protein